MELGSIIKDSEYTGSIIGKFRVLNYSNGYYNIITKDKDNVEIYKASLNEILLEMPKIRRKKLMGNPYIHYSNKITEIIDINGINMFIDTEDFESIRDITWRAEPDLGVNNYIVRGGIWRPDEIPKWKHITLHTYIFNMYGIETNNIFHKDNNGLNLTKDNLSIESRRTNKQIEANKNRAMTTDDYIRDIKEKGINIEVNDKYINTTTPIKHICPKCKRKDWMIRPNDVLQGKMKACKECSKLTLEKYKARLTDRNINIRVVGSFIDSHTKIEHECPICKRVDWMAAPVDILRGKSKMCKACSVTRKESDMAVTLKQVIKNKYSNTIYEYDAGFRGPRGGLSLYDIYIPEINTLVECQSEWHDTYNAMETDKFKKEYALNKGYNFVELDSREYTPLQAIQYFFTDIEKIPKYVDLSYGLRNGFDYEQAQILIDTGMSYTEVAEEMGVTCSVIYHYISRNKLKRYNR